MSEAKKSGYVEEVNIARGVAIFLAVLGHAFISNTSGVQLYIFNFIYGFHMPLFFFISGYCNSGILKKDTWKDNGKAIYQRFLRLMIPYFTFAVIYVFLDIIGGKYTLGEFQPLKYAVDLIKGDNANWQLWTLYVLFTCFALTALLHKKLSLTVLLIISGAISITMRILGVIPGLPSWLFYTVINKTAINWFFFVGGMFIRTKFDIFKRKKVNLLLLLLGTALLVGISFIRTRFNLELMVLITAPLGSLLVSELSKYAVALPTVKKIFTLFGDYCMEIYIFANICQVLVRTVLFYKLRIIEPVCVVISLLAGLFIPIFLCKFIVNKVRLFRILFLGNLKKGKKEIIDARENVK